MKPVTDSRATQGRRRPGREERVQPLFTGEFDELLRTCHSVPTQAQIAWAFERAERLQVCRRRQSITTACTTAASSTKSWRRRGPANRRIVRRATA